MATTDIHALAGAYVLDAVDDVERAAFTRHLAECETCLLEVAELRETTARLADATWSAPPPRMRDEVMARIRTTRQVGPGRPASSPSTVTSLARWRRGTAIAVAAGILAVGGGAATYAVQHQEVRREQAINQSVRAVLAAPDAVVRKSPVAGGGQLTVVLSRSQDRGVVVLDAATPADDKAYQLWTIDGPTAPARSAGVLAAGEGSVTRVIDGVAAAQVVALTVEPAGGSSEPTLPIAARIPTA